MLVCAVFVATKNSYSFKKNFLMKIYPEAKANDSKTPIRDSTCLKKSLNNNSAIKNIDRTNNKISKIRREDFIMLNAYAGTIFSFQ